MGNITKKVQNREGGKEGEREGKEGGNHFPSPLGPIFLVYFFLSILLLNLISVFRLLHF